MTTIYIAGGDGRGDDMEFIAGEEYIFVVDADWCTQTTAPDYDIALGKIKAPVTGVDLGTEEDVTIELINKGTKALENIVLSYTVNDGPAVEETLDFLDKGAAQDYTFKQKADLSQSETYYEIKVSAIVTGDADADNNTAQATVFHCEPVDPPFSCEFSTEEERNAWTVIDADRDLLEWYFEGGMACIDYSRYGNPLDDWLVTLRPVTLEAGDAYFAFEYNSKSSSYPEKLAVYYGTSADPEEMILLEDIEIESSAPSMYFSLQELDIAEAGNYYFAFHAHSDGMMMGLKVDNVEIGQGVYEGVPDLEITEIMLPVSACGLSAETPLQVRVSNSGQEDIMTLRLSYVLDGGTPVTQDFGMLPKASDEVFTFDQKMDLSVFGKHVVEVTGEILTSAGEMETNMGNNSGRDSVISFEPLEAPFSTDVSNPDQAAGWVGNWIWDETTGGYVTPDLTSLVSRCVSLEAGGRYRFSMEYLAGINFEGMIRLPETFCILYGESGTDMGAWDTLWYEPSLFEESFKTEDVSFECEKTGDYSFAIYSIGGLWIKEIMVSELTDYDVRVNSYALPLARLVPAEHVNAHWTASVEVQNRGAMPVDAKVEVLNGTEVVGTANVSMSELDQGDTVEVEFDLDGFAAGDVFTLTFRATVLEHAEDDLTHDNELQKRVNVTRDEMAYDNVTNAMFGSSANYAVGADYVLAAGIPFRLTAKDTLTGISVGWAEPAGEEVTLLIHKWDADSRTLGSLVYEAKVSAGNKSEFARYEIPGLLLEAGDYMISEKSSGYILMADGTADGFLYITSVEPPVYQQGLGYPAIRAILGSTAVLSTKDAAAEEIVRPGGDGLFSANQEVEVRVRNMGYEKATIPVVLKVNDAEPLPPQSVTLEPYATGTVVFTADMSASSAEYVLTAIVQLDGDENAANDTVVKIVNSLVPANPYEMDFESCADWATEAFNPAWTTVDGDGSAIIGWTDYAYPLQGETVGFFVFNPALTEPSLLADAPEMVRPHSGERFGASMFTKVANDDWLISPKLLLPGSDAKASFYVKSFSGTYGLEEYNVYVSETDNQLENFVQIGETREAPADAWTLDEVDLSAYAGKEIHLAIQCVSFDRFMFMIDDIRISEPTATEGDLLESQLRLYPNPASEVVHLLSTDARIDQVSILNVSGSLVYESAAGLNQGDFRYNVSGLHPGLYLIRVRTDQGTAVLKMMVK